eukprot:scaffold26104_cov122-Isochrysis_galbana.AAC.6
MGLADSAQGAPPCRAPTGPPPVRKALQERSPGGPRGVARRCVPWHRSQSCPSGSTWQTAVAAGRCTVRWAKSRATPTPSFPANYFWHAARENPLRAAGCCRDRGALVVARPQSWPLIRTIMPCGSVLRVVCVCVGALCFGGDAAAAVVVSWRYGCSRGSSKKNNYHLAVFAHAIKAERYSARARCAGLPSAL